MSPDFGVARERSFSVPQLVRAVYGVRGLGLGLGLELGLGLGLGAVSPTLTPTLTLTLTLTLARTSPPRCSSCCVAHG